MSQSRLGADIKQSCKCNPSLGGEVAEISTFDQDERRDKARTKNLFQRASEIDKAVSGDFNLLRVIVNAPWRKASAYVHGTASSITSRVTEQDGGIVIHRKFTEEEAAAALCC